MKTREKSSGDRRIARTKAPMPVVEYRCMHVGCTNTVRVSDGGGEALCMRHWHQKRVAS
jgi:hypothetical protein